MSINHIKELVNQTPMETPPSFIAMDLANFLELKIPPRELILSPWLPTAGLCMIHAFRGYGKTYLSLGIACAVATGSDFLNWHVPQPRNVLYVDGEMPASVLQERLSQILLMNKTANLRGNLNIITPDVQTYGIPNLATKESQVLLEQHITDETDLIIIDNLSCLAPSIKENDATDWSIIQTWVLGLRARGKSVLLIHHSGKNGTQRGTSRKEDVLDTVITLERPDNYEANQGARFIVKFEKSRGFCGLDAKPFEAQLCSDKNGDLFWETKPLEDTKYEKIINMLNEGISQIEISKKLKIDKSGVTRYAKKARSEGRLQSQPKVPSC